jgi:hypothetical protein
VAPLPIIFIPEESGMKMRATIVFIALMVSEAVLTTPELSADSRNVVRIFWAKRECGSPHQKSELRRLLLSAVAGQPSGQLLIRDSRPQVHGDAVAEMERKRAEGSKK